VNEASQTYIQKTKKLHDHKTAIDNHYIKKAKKYEKSRGRRSKSAVPSFQKKKEVDTCLIFPLPPNSHQDENNKSVQKEMTSASDIKEGKE